MGHLLRVDLNWTGARGGAGLSQFFFQTNTVLNETPSQTVVDQAVGKVNTFITTARDWLPDDITLSVDPTATLIEDTDGSVKAELSSTGSTQTGAGTGLYAAPAGVVINWLTNTWASKKNGSPGTSRLRGKTFLVPLAGTAYEADGTLTSAMTAAITTQANNLRAAGTGGFPVLAVWRRPVNGLGGLSAPVSAVRVPDKVCILRSRRD